MREGPWAIQHTINGQVAAASTWTNMPAAQTFLFNSHRHVIMADISGMTKIRFKVNKQGTAGSVGSKLILRYSPVFSTSVNSFSDIGVSEVSVPIDITNTILATDWIEIDNNCLAFDDIYIGVIGVGGNGTLDPQFGNISVSFC